MKKILFFIAALAMDGATATMASEPQTQTQSQTNIEVAIEGLPEGSVLVEFAVSPELSSQGNPLNIDAFVRAGLLEVENVPITAPSIVTIRPKALDTIIPFDGGGYATLGNNASVIEFPLLPGDRIKVRGRVVDKHIEAEISGTERAAVASELRREMLPDKMFFDSLHIATAQGDGYGSEGHAEMMRKYDEYTKNKYSDGLLPAQKWLQANPDSPAIDFVLAEFFGGKEMLERYPQLVEKARGEAFGPMIDARIRRSQAAAQPAGELKVGDLAPPISLPTADGATFSLADIEKEYVVIDFWASWCGPCIGGFPKMKEYYGRYGDRLEILGVATNDTRSAWLGALGKHALPWPGVLDVDNAVSKKYGVEALPTKLILGPDRRIAAILEGEGETFYEKLDELLK